MKLEFEDKQLLVKISETMFGTSSQKDGEITEAEVLEVGREATRYKVGNIILVYKSALQKINNSNFKEGEFLIESESVGRGVICRIVQ